MSDKTLSCSPRGFTGPLKVSDHDAVRGLIKRLETLYRASTAAGDDATRYWADIAIRSKSPFAPLAHVPGVFAALWTPDVAPQTALILGTAGFNFLGVPRSLVHFSTADGAAGIARTGVIHSTRWGLFGPGAYLANVGRHLNLFVRASARTPVLLETPAGTARIIPYLVYVRWGLSSLPIVLK